MGALYLRPDADQSDGSWLNESASNTNLYASVDEATTPSDSDYIQSSTTTGDKVRLRLSDPGTTVSAPMIVRYRGKRGSGSASAGVTGRLFQATTQIATWTQGLDDTLTTYTYTLTSGEFSSISDFNDLFVEFEYVSVWWLANASIDLDFADALYYDSSAGGTGQAVTTYLSCTRASDGYAKNLDGTLTSFSSNVLRIGVGTGLLVEDARTNLMLRSQEFDNASWNNISVTVTADQFAAPDGTTTMDKISDGTGNDRHILYQSVLTSSNPYVFSVFAKDIDRRYLFMAFEAPSLEYAYFDLQTGIVTDTSGVTATIEAFGNGIYRCSIYDTSVSGSNVAIALSDRPDDSTGSFAFNYPSYTGTNKSMYVWGAQAENASFVSSYIPTTSAAATRAADVVTCLSTLNSILVADSDQSAVVDCRTQGTNNFTGDHLSIINDAGGHARMRQGGSTTADTEVVFHLPDDIQVATLGNSLTFSGGVKVGYSQNTALGYSIVGGGGTVGVYSAVHDPLTGSAVLGGNWGFGFGTNFIYFRRVTAWNSKLADATLQAMTAP